MKYIIMILLMLCIVGCSTIDNATTPPKPEIPKFTLIAQQDGISVYRIFDHDSDNGYQLKALCYLVVSEKDTDLECP